MSHNINDFAEKMEMTEIETKRLNDALEKVNTGQVSGLPSFVRASLSEGLSSLVDNLKKTHFIE